jgi:hypothetical protein
MGIWYFILTLLSGIFSSVILRMLDLLSCLMEGTMMDIWDPKFTREMPLMLDFGVGPFSW